MSEHPFVEHIPRLRRYARSLTTDRHAADDLVQDTLERAWNKYHLWRPGSDLRAWLFTIMHNVFINNLRSRRRELDRPLEDLPPMPVHGMQAETVELTEIDRAMARLSAEHREILMLVVVEQLSYGEAGRVLGVPIGTVMSRLARARERLRTLTETPTADGMPLKVVK